LNRVKYQFNFQKFCLALNNLAKNSTLEQFQQFRLTCGQPNGFAIPITFLSFYDPEKYPMADAIIADWWRKNKSRFGYGNSPNFTPQGMISGRTENIKNNWSAYLKWTNFCRKYANIISIKSQKKWRARDIEMAIFFNHRNRKRHLSDFEEVSITEIQNKQTIPIENFNYEASNEILNSKSESQRYFRQGFALKENDLWEDAYPFFCQATNYDSKNLMAWFNQALCLQKMNKYPEAIKCYNKILEIDPNEEEAKQELSICIQRVKKQNANVLDSLTNTDVNYAPKSYNYWSNGMGPKRNLFKHSQCFSQKRKP